MQARGAVCAIAITLCDEPAFMEDRDGHCVTRIVCAAKGTVHGGGQGVRIEIGIAVRGVEFEIRGF